MTKPKRSRFRGGFNAKVNNEEKISTISIASHDEKYSTRGYTAEETLGKIADTNLSIGIINSDILLKAPDDFFVFYDKYVKEVVTRVQTSLAEDSTSETIAMSQADPTNEDLKKKARVNVTQAILKYADSSAGGKFLSRLTASEMKVINALVINEMLGIGPLEPLWNDTEITEIIANGPDDVQVEIRGQIHQVPSCHFRNADHLMDLIQRLYKSINKEVTRNDPLVKGRLHDKSRMYAVHPFVAPDGPNFNIRRHSNDYFTPERIIGFDTADKEVMAYLGNMIHSGASYLIIGGTGTGKTSLLDALTSYIRPDKRGLTLEDNLEMKPHPKKLWAASMETISPKPGSLNDQGITMRDLVRAATQMRPETIIIGEVTDAAAYDLCQALNTGHDGGSTVHANGSADGMRRLMSLVSQSGLVKEHAAYDLIASAFDIVITLKRFPDGSRKIVEIGEVGYRPVTDDQGNRMLPIDPLWRFDTNIEMTREKGKISGVWTQVGELSDRTREKLYLDIKPELTWEELEEIAKL